MKGKMIAYKGRELIRMSREELLETIEEMDADLWASFERERQLIDLNRRIIESRRPTWWQTFRAFWA